METFVLHAKFVVKRLAIATLITLLIYLSRYTIFGVIVESNLTGFDVLIGGSLPWLLAGLTWWFTYRSIKKYFQKTKSISKE